MKRKLLIIVLCMLLVFVSNNLFGNTKTNKRVNYNGSSLLVNIDGVYSDKIPTSGDYFLTSYKCSNSNTKVSWDNDEKTLSFSNGTNEGGIACSLNFSSEYLLSDVEVGSYVKYCVDDKCEFNNANYVSDTDMGYCGYKGSSYYNSDSDRKFTSNGFRVAYVKYGSVYLVTGGAISCEGYESTIDIDKYCNKDLVYQGKCNNDNIRFMNSSDFLNIINYENGYGSIDKISTCADKLSDDNCGYNNTIIDNGGFYWFSSGDDDNYYYWDADNRSVGVTDSKYEIGKRVVIKLSTSLIVESGDGTAANPYVVVKGKRSC